MASKANLKVVSTTPEDRSPIHEAETAAARIARLQKEARRLASGQVDALSDLVRQVADQARLIADGGDAYPVGVRELAGRLAVDLPYTAENLQVISSRNA